MENVRHIRAMMKIKLLKRGFQNYEKLFEESYSLTF